jgi:alkylation response protein AidB-like acyl-CoA dehydrogenase
MPVAISDEHRQLAAVARALVQRSGSLDIARRTLDGPEELAEELWPVIVDAGFLALHLPEEWGGQGFGWAELAVVLEVFGEAMVPGSFLPSCAASAVLSGSGNRELAERWVPGLADGSLKGAFGINGWALGGGPADVFVLVEGDDLVVASRGEVTAKARENLDLTRRVVQVEVPEEAVRIPGQGRSAVAVGRVLAAAEAAGISHACTDMAVEYAKVRTQFGRVIGSFMAVKHHCANMRAQAELATAAAWDASRARVGTREAELAAAVAAAVALPAASFCAKTNIQVHGGIGYTWEHPAHMFMRRAGAMAALFGPLSDAQAEVYQLMQAGVSRRAAVDLPLEAEHHRTEVRSFLTGLPEKEPDRRQALVDSGYMVPHWPKPWGREAGPVEQLVIDEEFDRAGVARPEMGIGGWVTLTFTQHGTPDQVARWTRQSLVGETNWCQLFSEPNAGSDAAGVQTRATRVEGGWLVNGQKLWTSGAHLSTHGFATVRTDPEAQKHHGITMMAIDLASKGVTIRPLRSIAGHSHFNEVFFDDVFVPDDDVVGQVDGGWAVARATLGNERVTIGAGRVTGREHDEAALMRLAAATEISVTGAAQIGAVMAEGQALGLINTRSVMRAVMGVEPSAEGSVTKLLNAEHSQRVTDLAMAIAGPEGAVVDTERSMAARWISVRSLSIAGGTSEIARNQIGERVLGLPREPGLR